MHIQRIITLSVFVGLCCLNKFSFCITVILKKIESGRLKTAARIS